MFRINGQQCIAYTPFSCPCSLSLVVCLLSFSQSIQTSNFCFSEPNNASPLNSDAAALWDNPEGNFRFFSGISWLSTDNYQRSIQNPTYEALPLCERQLLGLILRSIHSLWPGPLVLFSCWLMLQCRPLFYCHFTPILVYEFTRYLHASNKPECFFLA